MTEVKRFNSTQPLASVTGGHWVKASDYDALAAKLADVEAERDALKAQPKGITIDMANAPQLPPEAFDPIKDMLIEGLIAGGNEWKDRAEAAEARIAYLENHIEAVAKDTHKIMLRYEEAALSAIEDRP